MNIHCNSTSRFT